MTTRSPVLDLDPDLIPIPDQASERPAAPDSLDTWEWQADEHGADELNALDQDAVNVHVAVIQSDQADDIHKICEFAPQPADRMAQVAAIEAMTDDELRAWMDGFAHSAPDTVVETTTVRPAEPLDDTPGASYVGEPLIVEKNAHNIPSWLRQVGDIGPMERLPNADRMITLGGDWPGNGPPLPSQIADPKVKHEYYALLGKAKYAKSEKQARWLRNRAAAVLDGARLVPRAIDDDVDGDYHRAEGWGCAPLTSKKAFYRLPASIGAQQAALFGGAT